MKKIIFFLFVPLPCTTFCQRISKNSNGIATSIDGINIQVQFFSPGIVRILKSPEGSSFKKESFSVIKKPETIQLHIEQQGDVATIKSEALQVDLNVHTGKISFRHPAGSLLFTEKDYGTQLTPLWDVNKNTFIVRQAYMLDKDEVI